MTDFEGCKALYSETFQDSGVFCEKLFETNFTHCIYKKSGGRVASMLFALPCVIETAEKTYKAKYIFAAATDPAFRGQGLMSDMINDLGREEVLFLKPATAALQTFYERLGFSRFSAQKKDAGTPRALPCGNFAKLSAFDGPTGEEYTAMYRYKEPLNLNGLNFSLIME